MKVIKLDDFKITTDETLELIIKVKTYIIASKFDENDILHIDNFGKNLGATFGFTRFKHINNKELVIIEYCDKLYLTMGIFFVSRLDVGFAMSIKLSDEEYINYKEGQDEN